ncbi:MAG: pyrroline-5-carboxylate reductase [Thermoleophilaceae bacterium]|nr:pyrroline-5-carboxylate reductase [Thermoleophilaceae bacterium]
MEVGIIGAGNMARAIALGLDLPVHLTDSGSGRAAQLAQQVGGTAHASNQELAAVCDLIVLCHKPAQLATVAGELEGFKGELVSALAATPVATLQDAYPGASVTRIMPNTPVEIGQGVVCIARAAGDSQPPSEAVVALFEHLGELVVVDEAVFEQATALGGCGPAFYALFAEAFIDAAVAQGMQREQASQIAAHTLTGTGALLQERNFDTAAVQREVASPGGLTERALRSLNDAGLQSIVADAVDAVLGKEAKS